MKNRLEDFTEGSEWKAGDFHFKFSHFDPKDGLPLFIPLGDYNFEQEEDGTVVFSVSWKYFTKVESK